MACLGGTVMIVTEGGYLRMVQEVLHSSTVVYKINQTGQKPISNLISCSQTTNDWRLNPFEWRQIERSSSSVATTNSWTLPEDPTSASPGKHLHRIRRICSHSVTFSSLWKCQALQWKSWPSTKRTVALSKFPNFWRSLDKNRELPLKVLQATFQIHTDAQIAV